MAELDNRAVSLATPPALRELVGGRRAREADIRGRWSDECGSAPRGDRDM